MMTSLDLLLDLEPRPAAWNMALDEALLEAAARTPVLRFYRWERPAVSFGCLQPWAGVAERFPDRELVRRPTGGGAVEHGDGGETATYALVVPRVGGALAALGERPLEAFRRVHGALAQGLSEQGFAVELYVVAAAQVGSVRPGACFQDAPVLYDLVFAKDGRKIAGAAHRRTRTGLLHQGSIRLANVDVPRLAEDFAASLTGGSKATTRTVLAPNIQEAAAELVQTKYATRAWTERR